MKTWTRVAIASLFVAALTGCGEDKVVKVEGKEDGVYRKSIDRSRDVAGQGSAVQHDGEAILSGPK